DAQVSLDPADSREVASLLRVATARLLTRPCEHESCCRFCMRNSCNISSLTVRTLTTQRENVSRFLSANANRNPIPIVLPAGAPPAPARRTLKQHLHARCDL